MTPEEIRKSFESFYGDRILRKIINADLVDSLTGCWMYMFFRKTHDAGDKKPHRDAIAAFLKREGLPPLSAWRRKFSVKRRIT
jgi:hypothetical protein